MNERSLSLRALAILAVGTVVAAVGASVAMATFLAPRPVVSAAPDAGSENELRALREELARFRKVLEQGALERVSRPAPAERSDRVAVGAEPALSSGEVDRLEKAFTRLEVALREEHTATRAALEVATGPDEHERPKEIDWTGWRELFGVYQGDEEAARGTIRLLTTDQLLARYGPPSAVAPRDDCHMWYYYDAPDGPPLSVTLKVMDGYVTQMWMEAAN